MRQPPHMFTSRSLSTSAIFWDMQQTIAGSYKQLLGKQAEPFLSIAMSTTNMGLVTIGAIMEDFIIKALLQSTEILAPSRPKRFMAFGLSIADMAKSSFNAYWITKHNNKISALISETDLLVDISDLHEVHLHHLEDKTDATNKLLGDILESNIWFLT
jgi:hypothetical protein